MVKSTKIAKKPVKSVAKKPVAKKPVKSVAKNIALIQNPPNSTVKKILIAPEIPLKKTNLDIEEFIGKLLASPKFPLKTEKVEKIEKVVKFIKKAPQFPVPAKLLDEVLEQRNSKRLEPILEYPAKVTQIWGLSSGDPMLAVFLLSSKNYAKIELSRWNEKILSYVPFKSYTLERLNLIDAFTAHLSSKGHRLQGVQVEYPK